MAKSSRILKVAGLSFVGFCAVALAADKASLAPAVAQIAGFCGAFAGALVGGRRSRSVKQVPSAPSGEDQNAADMATADEDEQAESVRT